MNNVKTEKNKNLLITSKQFLLCLCVLSGLASLLQFPIILTSSSSGSKVFFYTIIFLITRAIYILLAILPALSSLCFISVQSPLISLGTEGCFEYLMLGNAISTVFEAVYLAATLTSKLPHTTSIIIILSIAIFLNSQIFIFSFFFLRRLRMIGLEEGRKDLEHNSVLNLHQKLASIHSVSSTESFQ